MAGFKHFGTLINIAAKCQLICGIFNVSEFQTALLSSFFSMKPWLHLHPNPHHINLCEFFKEMRAFGLDDFKSCNMPPT